VSDFLIHPAWSPEGGRIAFADDVSIKIVKSDGTGLKSIYEFTGEVGGDPSWSPDGAQIVLEDGGDLYVIDAGGGDARHLTNLSEAGGFDACPDWSPDGRQIAFMRAVESEAGTKSAIFVIKPDGSGEQQLTQTK
jgi:Tol biopolymer transport system component